MGDANGAAPSLRELVDLAAQLRRDEARPAAELRRRDRAIGRELGGASRTRLLAWLARVGGDRESGPSPGERTERVRRLLGAGLAAFGLFSGWGVSRVVYFYDGSRPINAVEVLVVFVALPLALLGVTAIAALPASARRPMVGITGLQEGLSVLSPGRWQGLVARFLPQTEREAFDLVLGRGRSHRRLFARVHKWAVLAASQSFGVAFHVGALAGCLYLVFFTDLAFGWSTTLQVESGQLHQVTRWLAVPWRAFAPDANPTLDLIDATRYFRLGRGVLPGGVDPPAARPAALGGWWPFCVACMVAYGLLPRLVLWVVARVRLRAAVTEAFDHYPGVADVRERLEHPLVETVADEPERAAASLAMDANGGAAANTAARVCVVVNWSAVDVEELVLAAHVGAALGWSVLGTRSAGGAGSLQDDRDTIAFAAAAGGGDECAVVIAVRAWEPPVLEFLDFVRELRAALDERAAIAVVPVALDARGQLVETPESDLAQWRKRLARLGDPWLSVRALGEPS